MDINSIIKLAKANFGKGAEFMTDLIISIVIAVFIVAGVIYTRKHFKRQVGCCGGGGDYVSKKKLKKVTAKKVFNVEGIVCEKCKARAERYVNEINGIKATVDVKKKQMTVLMEKQVSDEEIIAAVEKAGYKVII